MKNLKKVYIAGKLNDETCIDYLNNCGLMMEHANDVHDAVYVCPNWETSPGTKREIELAESLGIPVAYSIDELQKVCPSGQVKTECQVSKDAQRNWDYE